MTSSTTTAVITHEFSCQLQSKLLHILVDVLRAKVLLKNVGIGNSNVEEKVKYVPVELSALRSTGIIIPMQLVSSINPSHVLVQLNCFRTADGSASVVLQSPENWRCCSWLGIAKHHHYHLSVHPCTCTDVSFLNYQ